MITVAVEPKTKADQDKLSKALVKLADEDPTFRVRRDEETGQTVIAGMGELHLEIIVDRLKREFKVEANIGAPQVPTARPSPSPPRRATAHKKQSGGSGQYADVSISFEPLEPGHRLRVRDRHQGRFRAQGVHPRRREGPRGGHGLRDPRRLPRRRRQGDPLRRQYHDVDSSVMAFEIAGRAGVPRGPAKGRPELLEPDDAGRRRHPRGVHG